MNFIELLNELEDELDSAFSVPGIGRALVNREKCLDVIKDMRLHFPDELKQADWIMKERKRILADAQKEAETLISEAEDHLKALVNESEVMKEADNQAKDIINSARESAKEIRLGAIEYADEVLENAEKYVAELFDLIKVNRMELKKQ